MDYKVSYRKKDKKVQCVINYKINNTWKQKASQKYTTQKEYKEWIRKTIKELEDKSSLDTVEEYRNSTLGELIGVFIEHQKLYKEPNTIKGYTTSLNLLINLYDRDIETIKKHDIQVVVDSLISTGIKSSSLKEYINKLSYFFKYLMKDLGLITKNPCNDLNMPKSKEKTSKRSLNDKEITLMLDKFKDNKYFIVYFIALNTGMRLGEILGLTWDNVDYSKQLIHVKKQWKKFENTNEGFGTLKAKNSIRSIPVSRSFIDELKAYKSKTPLNIHNRVACFPYHSQPYIDTKLKKLLDITLHELRHTYATKLIANGLDFKTVAKILGHEVEQTLKTYSHVTDDMMKNASNLIEKIF